MPKNIGKIESEISSRTVNIKISTLYNFSTSVLSAATSTRIRRPALKS
ncbi:MAG: hypothetical protein ACYDEG_07650 [bacterium]